MSNDNEVVYPFEEFVVKASFSLQCAAAKMQSLSLFTKKTRYIDHIYKLNIYVEKKMAHWLWTFLSHKEWFLVTYCFLILYYLIVTYNVTIQLSNPSLRFPEDNINEAGDRSLVEDQAG